VQLAVIGGIRSTLPWAGNTLMLPIGGGRKHCLKRRHDLASIRDKINKKMQKQGQVPGQLHSVGVGDNKSERKQMDHLQ